MTSDGNNWSKSGKTIHYHHSRSSKLIRCSANSYLALFEARTTRQGLQRSISARRNRFPRPPAASTPAAREATRATAASTRVRPLWTAFLSRRIRPNRSKFRGRDQASRLRHQARQQRLCGDRPCRRRSVVSRRTRVLRIRGKKTTRTSR